MGSPRGVDPADLGRSLDEAMRLLSRATGQAAAAPPPVSGERADEPLRGHGTGGGGLVEAEVGGFGRLESLVISPNLLRAGTSVIAEYVREAVQAAQDDERRRRDELMGPVTPDPAALNHQLEGVAEEAWRGFNRMIGDLDALTRRLDRK